jgi:5'(3')-deoxyribonucleotidase
LFSAPHNSAVKGFHRVANWREVEDFFLLARKPELL